VLYWAKFWTCVGLSIKDCVTGYHVQLNRAGLEGSGWYDILTLNGVGRLYDFWGWALEAHVLYLLPIRRYIDTTQMRHRSRIELLLLNMMK